MTASMAAFAVANSGPKKLTAPVAITIFVLGAVQQSMGYVIDRIATEGDPIADVVYSRVTGYATAFIVAVLCQVCEALLVATEGDPKGSLFGVG